MNYYQDDLDPDDVVCRDWAQPHIALADLPRIAQDHHGLASAAEDIAADPIAARDALASSRTDPRLIAFINRALRRNREAS